VADLLLGAPGAIAAAKQLTVVVPSLDEEAAFAWTAELSAGMFAGVEAERHGRLLGEAAGAVGARTRLAGASGEERSDPRPPGAPGRADPDPARGSVLAGRRASSVAVDVMERLVTAGDLEHALFFVGPRPVVVHGHRDAVAERPESLVEEGLERIPWTSEPTVAWSSNSVASGSADRPRAAPGRGVSQA